MSNKLVKPQSNDIIIDDGLKTYYIKNKQGHVYGKFDFRPSDTNLISRYDEVVEHLNSFSDARKRSGGTLKRLKAWLLMSFPI